MPTQGPLATGYLHLSFPSHPPPATQQLLSLFRPSAFPLGIIGVATCSSHPLSKTLSQFEENLSNITPPGSIFPLVQQCFAFEDEGEDGCQLVNDQVSGIEVIPSMDTNKTKMHIGTLLASLCSRILGELSLLVSCLRFTR
jgi:trafficking protein particle complex subunit 9